MFSFPDRQWPCGEVAVRELTSTGNGETQVGCYSSSPPSPSPDKVAGAQKRVVKWVRITITGLIGSTHLFLSLERHGQFSIDSPLLHGPHGLLMSRFFTRFFPKKVPPVFCMCRNTITSWPSGRENIPRWKLYTTWSGNGRLSGLLSYPDWCQRCAGDPGYIMFCLPPHAP